MWLGDGAEAFEMAAQMSMLKSGVADQVLWTRTKSKNAIHKIEMIYCSTLLRVTKRGYPSPTRSRNNSRSLKPKKVLSNLRIVELKKMSIVFFWVELGFVLVNLIESRSSIIAEAYFETLIKLTRPI